MKLCTCDEKKIRWYLKKNLATLESEDPLVIKLNFMPGILFFFILKILIKNLLKGGRIKNKLKMNLKMESIILILSKERIYVLSAEMIRIMSNFILSRCYIVDIFRTNIKVISLMILYYYASNVMRRHHCI